LRVALKAIDNYLLTCRHVAVNEEESVSNTSGADGRSLGATESPTLLQPMMGEHEILLINKPHLRDDADVSQQLLAQHIGDYDKCA
jgi:hypothetical protein